MKTVPRIDGFEIIGELGSGAMGAVYIANQLRLDRRVAIKVLHANLASDPGLVARFEREARTLARLRHENIVSVFDYGIAKGSPYIAMDYIEGTSLDLALTGKPLPPQEVLQILKQVAAALDCAHAAGVVHRDVKPANILYQRDGKVLLTDFGIAKNSDSTGMTNTGMSLGTPLYMAPEVCRGQVATAASDLYALGVMTFELVTGKRPFDGSDPFAVIAMHVNQPPPDPRKVVPTLPGGMTEFFALAMAKEPSRRFKSAGALVSGFSQAVAFRAAQTHSPPRSKVVPIALAAALLGGVAATIVILNGSGGSAGGGGEGGRGSSIRLESAPSPGVIVKPTTPESAPSAPFPSSALEAFNGLDNLLEKDTALNRKRPWEYADFEVSNKQLLNRIQVNGKKLSTNSDEQQRLLGNALLCGHARLLMEHYAFLADIRKFVNQVAMIDNFARNATTLDGSKEYFISIRINAQSASKLASDLLDPNLQIKYISRQSIEKLIKSLTESVDILKRKSENTT